MSNPIASFCSCDECGAKINDDCDDCLNHSSRIHKFISEAPLSERIKAQNFSFYSFPESIKKDILEQDDSSLFLSKKEFLNWKNRILQSQI